MEISAQHDQQHNISLKFLKVIRLPISILTNTCALVNCQNMSGLTATIKATHCIHAHMKTATIIIQTFINI